MSEKEINKYEVYENDQWIEKRMIDMKIGDIVRCINNPEILNHFRVTGDPYEIHDTWGVQCEFIHETRK